MSDEDWQDLVSHPGRRRIENGRVIATEPPPPSPDSQAEADRALLREAMLRDQLETWIEHHAANPGSLSPAELAALHRLRDRGAGRDSASFIQGDPQMPIAGEVAFSPPRRSKRSLEFQ